MQNQTQNPKSELKRRCTQFSLFIIAFLDKLSRNDFIVMILAKQLLRAATSIGANVVEATGAGTKKDFINFFTIALKSARETQYWLYLLRESGRSDIEIINQLLNEANQLAKMLSSSILTAKGHNR